MSNEHTLKRSVPHAPSNAQSAREVRIVGPDGVASSPTRVSWAGGTFALGGAPEPTDIDGSDLWMVAGLVDTHVHSAWHRFAAEDRAQSSLAERDEHTRRALQRTLHAGFTSIRDAGGLNTEATLNLQPGETPRLQHAVTMIDRQVADEAGGAAQAAERALAAGARWVKLVGTAGVAAPPHTDLAPVFSEREVTEVVAVAQGAGAGVMVHAWGGSAIDYAIAAGATSIEHGMYLTLQQAKRAAQRDMTFVPTLRIYRLVLQMIESGELPQAFHQRVADVVERHPEAVRIARDAGLAIALGSDYGTESQHGTNARELDALVAAGLTQQEALAAATSNGAALLAQAIPNNMRHTVPTGIIAEGHVADAVLCVNNPLEPGALSSPGAIHAVILDGQLLYPHRRKEDQ